MLNGLNLTELMQASEKIQAFIPQLKKFIPNLISAQESLKLKHKLNNDELILYSVMLSPKGTINIYCFKCLIAKEDFKVNEKTFPKNSVIIIDEIFKHEITQYLDVIEKNGIMGLMQVLPIQNIMSKF